MMKTVKVAIAISVFALASTSIASPKCSHRLASSTNDLFKNTNPVRTAVAKASISRPGKESSKIGIK